MNLDVAPAADLKTFASDRQTTNVIASVDISDPHGQYGPPPLANIGTNRWGTKPVNLNDLCSSKTARCHAYSRRKFTSMVARTGTGLPSFMPGLKRHFSMASMAF